MAVNLSKGEKVNLSKEVEKLANVTVGLGWDMSKNGVNIDCDSSVFVLKNKATMKTVSNGLFGLFKKEKEETSSVSLISSDDIVYYGHLSHRNGCIKHRGDNLVGGIGARNDDEQISINLKDMPTDVKRLIVAINIYACNSRGQHFGMIKNCYARIVDNATNKEICRYNLTEDYSGKTALIVGELYRENDEWHFQAVGKGTCDSSIESIANRYR